MDNKKLKVLFIIPSTNPGGIETYVYRFLKNYNNKENISFSLLVRTYENGLLFNNYKNLNIPITFRPLGYLSIKNLIWYYRYFKS